MFSTSQHFEWKFWCIPLGTTQNLFELVFLFLQKEAFAPTIIFPDVHDQEIDFRRKSGFPIFSSAEEFLLCSSFSGDQVLTSSLSKQPHIPTKFASSLTRYDTHKVHTAILSFSHLWGRLCPVNHLYGNVNIFKVYDFYFELWLELYKFKMKAKYLLIVFHYLTER